MTRYFSFLSLLASHFRVMKKLRGVVAFSEQITAQMGTYDVAENSRHNREILGTRSFRRSLAISRREFCVSLTTDKLRADATKIHGG